MFGLSMRVSRDEITMSVDDHQRPIKIQDETRPHEVMYWFRLASVLPGEIVVYEIKYTDTPPQAPLSKRYQWFIRQDQQPPRPLSLMHRAQNQRWFAEGIKLDLNDDLRTVATATFLMV